MATGDNGGGDDDNGGGDDDNGGGDDDTERFTKGLHQLTLRRC